CQRMKSSEVDGSNFSFVMDKEGNVIISPRHEGTFAATEMNHNLRKAEDKDLAETAERMAAGEHGIALVRADGEEYYLAFAPLSDLGWSMGTVIDKAQITAKGDQAEAYVGEVLQKYNADRKKFFLLMVAGAMLAFVIALYPILKANVKMAKGFADPINVLTDGVKEIAAGNLDRKLSIKTGDELEILADSFNRMTEDLAAHMESLASTTAQKERIETELSVGTRIQAGMLPDGRRPYAHRRDFELAAMMRPAREVGGDFYDFFFLDERHLVLTVADVSDKGVPAALFMVIAKTLLKENLLFAGGPEHLGEVFVKTNNALIRSNKENMFVTVFCGVLDTVTGEFAYVNAGHNPPVLRQQGKCRYLELAGYPVMGAVEDIPYSAERLNLQSGDAIFLYTDGVTEAMDAKLKLFGPQRLLQVLDTPGSSAEEEIEGVYEAVREYAGEAAQSDDITMLEMIYHGPERNKI
ncbi:MAG: SpoIIE family protein phosphatase, partial [Selenomonas sp.]|nr:SpoIIE family protein phosphatase [Selenomonas sp.]